MVQMSGVFIIHCASYVFSFHFQSPNGQSKVPTNQHDIYIKMCMETKKIICIFFKI